MPRTCSVVSRPLGVVALAAAAGVFAGCTAYGPPGDRGGNVDVYNRTPTDARAPEADTVNLMEFSDRVGEALAARIASIDEIRNSPTKVVIELASIKNDSPTTPTSDFALIQRRVFAKLVNSDSVRRYADIVERKSRVDEDIAMTRGGGPVDPADVSDIYATRDTYLLNGTFGEIVRGTRQHSYYFEMTLTNAKRRTIVFTEQMDSKQRVVR